MLFYVVENERNGDTIIVTDAFYKAHREYEKCNKAGLCVILRRMEVPITRHSVQLLIAGYGGYARNTEMWSDGYWVK